MSNRSIHGKSRALSASAIRSAIAADLAQIKHEDGLTFADLGRVLGKSEDQASKYCDGTAVMDAITYAFARDQWGSRFTGTLDALIASHKEPTHDRHKATAITKALMALSVALEDDDEASPKEVRKMRRELDEAQTAISDLLGKLVVRAA